MKSFFSFLKFIAIALFLLVLIFVSRTYYSISRSHEIFLDYQHEKSLAGEVWTLSSDSLTEVIPASISSNVYMDLLKAGKIDAPFYGIQEEKLAWIPELEWTYDCNFQLDTNELQHDLIALDFKGLDTHADVYLNDSLILKANNAFRSYLIPVQPLLKEKNHLRLVFHSLTAYNRNAAKHGAYPLPDDRGYSRKPAYQLGWDWGPKFPVVGITGDIQLVFANQVMVEEKSFVYRLDTVSKYNTGDLDLVLNAVDTGTLEINIKVNAANFGVLYNMKVKKGRHAYRVDFPFPKIEHWNASGMGEPNVMDARLYLQFGHTKILDSPEKIAFRRIELIQEEDSIGKSFGFRLNGKDFFAKGANYIPMDVFLDRVKEEDYRRLLSDVKASNMNMIRVWGGGVYEKDAFYDLCDEMGIMVWQDFMFACNFYPGDSAFLSNVTEEVRQQISRLKSHPCIALWCGNNEVIEAWENWGYQKALHYTKEDSLKAIHAYDTLFHHIIPDQLKLQHVEVPYWPSSPSIGWGHKESLKEGDSHYWGVWWGEEPFSTYRAKVPRFSSEYGFQAFPDIKTVKDFGEGDHIYLGSDVLQAHQKHPRGYELIKTYMARNFEVPDQLDDYIYSSQILQLYGITQALEAHRFSFPYCRGTLYWQLNDCWPVVSWSSIDSKGRWKPLHYQVKRKYADYALGIDKQGGKWTVCTVKDTDGADYMDGNIYLISNKGDTLQEWHKHLNPDKLGVIPLIEIEPDKLEVDPSSSFLLASLTSGSELINEEAFLLSSPKDVDLGKKSPEVSMVLEEHSGNTYLKLTANQFTPYIVLSSPTKKIHFEDNAFHLWPGKTVEVEMLGEVTSIDMEKDINLKSIWNNQKYKRK